MSRKSNNLKKRLAIVQAQLAKAVRTHEMLLTNNNVLRERLDAADARATKAEKERCPEMVRNIIIRVEQQPARRFPDYVASVVFQPQGFAYASFMEPGGDGFHENPAVNIGYMAAMIGDQIGRKVERAIVDQVRGELARR